MATTNNWIPMTRGFGGERIGEGRRCRDCEAQEGPHIHLRYDDGRPEEIRILTRGEHIDYRIGERTAAIRAGDDAAVTAAEEKLAALGVEIRDTDEGTRWRRNSAAEENNDECLD